MDSAATHDGQTMTAVGCLRLSEVSEEQIAEHDVIAIDEGQFFPDLEQYAELWANAGKCVIVAALDADYRRCVFRRGGTCPGGLSRGGWRRSQREGRRAPVGVLRAGEDACRCVHCVCGVCTVCAWTRVCSVQPLCVYA